MLQEVLEGHFLARVMVCKERTRKELYGIGYYYIKDDTAILVILNLRW